MNKLTKLLSVFIIAGAVGTGIAGVAGCKTDKPGGSKHTHNYSYVDDEDGQHHEHCGNDGCDTPDKPAEGHIWDADGNCEKCDAQAQIEISLNLSKRNIALTKTLELEATVTAGTGVDKSVTWSSSDDSIASVSNSGVVTGIKVGTVTITATTAVGGKTATCEITVKEQLDYEEVTTNCDLTALCNHFNPKNKLTEDYTYGKFTFSAGVYFDSTGDITGNTVNNQKKDIFFNLSGDDNGNSIKFDAKSASTGSDPTFTLYKQKGENVWEQVWTLKITTVTKDIVIDNLTAGYYKLSSDTSSRLGNISVTEKLEKTAAVGITVKNGTIKMLKGRTLSTNGVQVTLDYDNGRHDTVTDFDIDETGFDATTAGKYNLTVGYTLEGAETPFTAEIEVIVYQIDEIKLSDYSCTNQRVTQPVQKIFKLGETFNSKNLAVTAVCSAPDVDGTEEFILSATDSEYTVSTPNNGTTGKQDVTVTAADDKTASYSVYFVDVEDAVTDKVTVDASAETVSIGEDKIYTVSTVNQAIQMLKALGADEYTEKVVTIKAGSYKEKVEIDIPNVSLVGETDNADDVVLWYDLIAGFKDPSGTTAYSTDGSASVSIRASADGFHAENITFKNYYNTHALYQYTTTLHGDTQAVACLIQADMATFDNCKFTSYHDTLYAMYGRHLFTDCYIEGRTDYIFGDTATSYFKDCTIHTLGAGDAKNGGYIVATKGGGVVGNMKYGYIFNGCTIDGDDNVVDGTVSLARGWDKGMNIAFINCDISKAYSIEAYGDTSSPKNDRYTKMNADPRVDQLFEYNNTGAGALPQSVLDTANATTHQIANMCTILTAEQAAKYDDYSEVFDKTNGNVTYAANWDGTKGAKPTFKKYDFTVITTQNATDDIADVFGGEVIVNYEGNGRGYRWNGNCMQFSDGAELTFTRQGTLSMVWWSGFDLAKNGLLTYKDGIATLKIKGNPYIISVSLDLTEVPEDSVIRKVTFNNDDEGATENTVVDVVDGGKVTKPDDPIWSGHTFLNWYTGDDPTVPFDFNQAITADVEIKANWQAGEEEKEATLIESYKVFNFGKGPSSVDVIEKSVNNRVDVIDELLVDSKGTFASNGGGWYQIANGTTITLKVKAGMKVVFEVYKNGSYEVFVNGSETPATTTSEMVTSDREAITLEAQDLNSVIVFKSNCSGYVGIITVGEAE